MSSSKGYKINWNRNTMIMTKGFADKARVIGSQEYEDLMKMRTNGFHVVEKWHKPRKACPTRLTYRKMRNYIATRSDANERFAEFRKAIEESKSYHNPYEYVRQWFIKTFPEHIKSLEAYAAKKDNILQFPTFPDTKDNAKKDA